MNGIRLALKIGGDLSVAQVPHADGGDVHPLTQHVATGVVERQGGVKHQLAATGAPEHFDGNGHRAGLAQLFAIQQCHLVGADDQRIRAAFAQRARLDAGQPAGRVQRGLSGQRGFVTDGSQRLERQAQTGQHLAAETRGGSKDQTHESEGFF